MFEKIKSIFEKYVPENLTPEQLKERLAKSMPYDDGTLLKYDKSDGLDDKARLFIKPDDTAILIHSKTGKIPKAWKIYDIDPKAIAEYEKIYGISEAKALKLAAEKNKEKEIVSKQEPVVNVEKEIASKPEVNVMLKKVFHN